METPEEIYLKALSDIQNICYPILDSGKYDTSRSQIAEIASNAINDGKDKIIGKAIHINLDEIQSSHMNNPFFIEGKKSKPVFNLLVDKYRLEKTNEIYSILNIEKSK